jgi:hypothetical protein
MYCLYYDLTPLVAEQLNSLLWKPWPISFDDLPFSTNNCDFPIAMLNCQRDPEGKYWCSERILEIINGKSTMDLRDPGIIYIYNLLYHLFIWRYPSDLTTTAASLIWLLHATTHLITGTRPPSINLSTPETNGTCAFHMLGVLWILPWNSPWLTRQPG